ncbi:MAG: hypothetical protein M3P27_12540, partial [Acidobacteriota bacterium]|nr:hypothetical protein [Acidobacteriota bacterium]
MSSAEEPARALELVPGLAGGRAPLLRAPLLRAPLLRAPLLLAACAFSAGILFASYAWRPTLWWLLLAMLTVAAAGYLARRGPRRLWHPARLFIAYACAALLLATLGALDMQLRPPRLGDDLTAYLDGNEATITAHLVRDGMVAERGAEQRQIVDVETEQVEAAQSDAGAADPAAPARTLRARIRLSIY